MPRASRSQRMTAISRLTQLHLKVKTVPAPEEIVSGRYTVSDVRPIDVNDLLHRDPVQPLTGLIRTAVEGHTIMITGAGGSIGSEICRQIGRAGPRKLVLLDHSEFSLYSIDQQLNDIVEKLPLDERPEVVPIVGSMLNEALVRELIRDHGIDTIYHAAAYKHVPLLEHNEVVGVQNNVIGTLVLARAAMEMKLTRFTMISTDKAVRPESVMGASKRVAELIIQAFAEDSACETRFGIVRFGNVLDSSGSVVQRFRDQIRTGGPVTVTHEDITRFFMSIPEATQLVLQASAMANYGEVFVLDMGEPVKIADLARNMITLSGLTVRDKDHPGGDIEITYVGLRPGEKLFEELFVGEDAVETTHPRIKMARERSIGPLEMKHHVGQIEQAIANADRAAVRRKLDEITAPDRSDFDGTNVASFEVEARRRQRLEA
jgi:FlaA1/EpsC-like NDP-sugar epimerase